jgi:hypothetical protein
VTILQALGCQEVTTFNPHLFASRYVLRPNPSDMLLALKVALQGCDLQERYAFSLLSLCYFAYGIKRVAQLSNENKAKLMAYLSTQTIPDDLVPFVKQFPIFRNYTGNFATVAVYISPSPDQIQQDLLHGLSEFLDIPAPSTVFAQSLGARDISILDFYERFVFSRLDNLCSSIRDRAMTKLLRNLPEITNTKFLTVLANLQFVPTASGTK